MALENWVLSDGERAKEEVGVGVEVTLGRDGWVRGMGEADLEAVGVVLWLVEVEYSSSSTEIKRRVRGRRDELLLNDGEPLVGFMALVSRAQL